MKKLLFTFIYVIPFVLLSCVNKAAEQAEKQAESIRIADSIAAVKDAAAVSIAEEENVTCTDTKVTYDENLNPTINMTIKNSTKKVVTNVYISVIFRDKYSNKTDVTAETKLIDENISVSIPQGFSKNISFFVPAPYGGNFELSYMQMNKARFSDGSLMDL